MKLVTFESGTARYGAVIGNGIIDLGRRLGPDYPGLRAGLVANVIRSPLEAADGDAPDFALAEVRLLPPIPDPSKIICIGLNYRAHALEAGLKVPGHPSLFI